MAQFPFPLPFFNRCLQILKRNHTVHETLRTYREIQRPEMKKCDEERDREREGKSRRRGVGQKKQESVYGGLKCQGLIAVCL